MSHSQLQNFENELELLFEKYFDQKKRLNFFSREGAIEGAKWMKDTVEKAIIEKNILLKKYSSKHDNFDKELEGVALHLLKKLMMLPTNLNNPIKITYKSEKDEQQNLVHYFIEIHLNNEEVWWKFHPVLPEGVHWKKGDETGLGSDHDNGTQSFEDFKTNPKHFIEESYFIKAIEVINKYFL